MKTHVDTSGRLVIPKVLRDQIGMGPGEVEVFVDGAAIRIQPVGTDERIVDKGRFKVLAGRGAEIDDDAVRDVREADRR
jgi:AbrB family looped-hinge helix DNA binding protein